MKRQQIFWCFFIWFSALIIFEGCKQSKSDDPTPPASDWTEEDQQIQDHIVALQDQSSEVFHNYLLTMDTASAKSALAQWFQSDPEVEWAVVNEQGVAVQYKSGILSGIFIDPLDEPFGNLSYDMPTPELSSNDVIQNELKVIPNYKKALLYNSHYLERKENTDEIIQLYNLCLPKVGMSLAQENIYLNEKANIDVLKNLSKFGFIHFYSHGLAWPDENTISEVYMMTGEPIAVSTNAKYKSDVNAKKIIYLKFDKTGRHQYFVSPSYIADNNDFSKDTVLIYGGFCYGFLGTWKNLVEKTAAGAYVGPDWSVATNYNSGWARELIFWLCDKQDNEPLTLSRWYDGITAIPKSYTNTDGRVVSIKFHGHGDMKFWKKVTATIQPTAAGGVPVTNPGNMNTAYTFQADMVGAQADELKFTWNFGDGSPEQDVLHTNEISHTWASAGTFSMTVVATDLTTQELLAYDTVSVVILPDQEVIPILKDCNDIEVWLYSGEGNHYMNDGSIVEDGELYVSSTLLDISRGHITWDGLNFEVSGTYFFEDKDISISGSVSDDGNSLVYLKATRWYHDDFYTYDSLIIELSGLPLTKLLPSFPLAEYKVEGIAAQSHLNLFFKKEVSWQTYIYYSHSDWENASVVVNFFGAR